MTGLGSALRVASLFALFGGLWIIVSDRILEALVKDPHRITLFQTYKGWAFIAASTLLLYFSVKRELKARERAEEALRISEEKYRKLIETANDAIVIADAETGVIIDVNKKAEEMFGMPVEKIIGMHQDELHPKEEAERYRKIFSDAVKQGRALSGDLHVCCRDGKTVPVEVSANTLEIGGEKVIQGIFRDITERKRAEERIGHQVRMLNALHTIDMAITASLDLRLTLDILLMNVIAQLGVDAADVLLLNQHTQTLEFGAGQGFRSDIIKNSRMPLGRGYAGRAALERKPLYILNLQDAGNVFLGVPLIREEGFIAYCGVPLIAKGQVKGVLEVFHRSPLDPDPEWLKFLEALATEAAIAIDNATLLDNLQRSNIELTLAYDATLEGWGRALELRDKVTEGHTRRVTEMTFRLAREMGIKEEYLVHIRRGALLHDIGKIGIPDSILLKTGPLTEEEQEIMHLHPVYAFKMLQPIAFLHSALDIPYCHHERWNGTGYPRGLRGEQIPLAARIFAVVDVWDALSAGRPYQPAWPEEKIRDHILSLSGVHFDSEVAEVFLRMEWRSLS